MSVGAKIGAGFGLAIAVLILLGTVSYRSTNKLVENAQSVQHTHEVFQKLQNVLSLLIDAETGHRGYVITGQERYLDAYYSAFGRDKASSAIGNGTVAREIESIQVLTSDNAEQQKRIPRLKDRIAQVLVEFQDTIRQKRNQRYGAVPLMILTDMDQVRALIQDMKNEEHRLLAIRTGEAQASARNTLAIIKYGILLALILLTLMGLFLTRHIATPLKDISAAADRISTGDVTVDVSSNHRRDEVGALAQAFARMTQSLQSMADVAEQIAAGDLKVQVKPQSDKDMLGNSFAVMVQNLRQITSDVTEAVNVLGKAANKIVASSTELASGATETATAVSETTTTVEEIRQTAQVSNDKARQVADRALHSSRISQDGRQAIEHTSNGIQRIREQMESIAQSMVTLSEQSQAIGDIIATVDDLAQQSNLLAVNASIEAAKAGEQGKGFAVVAQEVKSLADQSKQATTQVRTILNDIQRATSAAVMATEQGSKAVEAGVVQAAQAGESILALTESVDESAQAATQIAASSQQQLVGMDQMVSAMESIRQASAQNVESARQLEVAAQGLNNLGQRLQELVGRYSV